VLDVYFFFQAEDGIRDATVTGVQTCALPIYAEKKRLVSREKVLTLFDPDPRGLAAVGGLEELKSWIRMRKLAFAPGARAYGLPKIGRASCRERAESWGRAVTV